MYACKCMGVYMSVRTGVCIHVLCNMHEDMYMMRVCSVYE